jgi:putative SOS response-associated peptidase YedK
MCNRYEIRSPKKAIAKRFVISETQLKSYGPNGDVRPTNTVPIIRMGDDGREATLVRWGLVPQWSATETPQYATFNAKRETLAESNTFRGPYYSRRCLIPADAFFEWRDEGGPRKTPYRFSLKDGSLFAFASLWERWERDGKVLDSCTIVTCPPNALLAEYHNRMPVVLAPDAHDRWLEPLPHKTKDERNQADTLLKTLLVPYVAGEMTVTQQAPAR